MRQKQILFEAILCEIVKWPIFSSQAIRRCNTRDDCDLVHILTSQYGVYEKTRGESE